MLVIKSYVFQQIIRLSRQKNQVTKIQKIYHIKTSQRNDLNLFPNQKSEEKNFHFAKISSNKAVCWLVLSRVQGMSRSCQKLNRCSSFSNYIFSSSSSSRSIFSPWPSSSSSSRFGSGSSSSFSYTRSSSSSSSRACSSSPSWASSSIFSSGLPPMPRSRRPSRPLSSSYSDALIKSSQVTLLPKN